MHSFNLVLGATCLVLLASPAFGQFLPIMGTAPSDLRADSLPRMLRPANPKPPAGTPWDSCSIYGVDTSIWEALKSNRETQVYRGPLHGYNDRTPIAKRTPTAQDDTTLDTQRGLNWEDLYQYEGDGQRGR